MLNNNGNNYYLNALSPYLSLNSRLDNLDC